MQLITYTHDQITNEQSEEFLAFEVTCFGTEKVRELRETLYFSEPSYHIVRYENDTLIAYLRVILRHSSWLESPILIGGIGSVCVHPEYRGQGLATQLLGQAMQVLKSEKCDIGLLQTNISVGGKLYGQFGFIPFNKPYTYLDSSDITHETKAKDVMIAPINDEAVVASLIASDEILHIGKGDW